MRKEFPQEIAERGFWRVNFRPLSSRDRLQSLGRAETTVIDSTVRLRGWPYPFSSNHKGLGENAIEYHGDFVEGWNDWEHFREFWRMFQSSQFINYRAVHEDWEERYGYRGDRRRYDPSSRQLRVLSTIFQVTEFFAFLARLGENGIYSNGANISISLRNSGPRSLVVDESRQLPFMVDKVSHGENLNFVTRAVTARECRDAEGNSSAALLELFDKFGWNPPEQQIKSQVAAYLSGRT